MPENQDHAAPHPADAFSNLTGYGEALDKILKDAQPQSAPRTVEQRQAEALTEANRKVRLLDDCVPKLLHILNGITWKEEKRPLPMPDSFATVWVATINPEICDRLERMTKVSALALQGKTELEGQLAEAANRAAQARAAAARAQQDYEAWQRQVEAARAQEETEDADARLRLALKETPHV